MSGCKKYSVVLKHCTGINMILNQGIQGSYTLRNSQIGNLFKEVFFWNLKYYEQSKKQIVNNIMK